MKNKKVSSSLEDYLETIYDLVNQKGSARAIDISKNLQVGKSSVTEALKTLSKKGFINYAPYESITMTIEGEKIAQKVAQKHATIKEFLVNFLDIEKEEAAQNACRMEHVISEIVFDKMRCFNEFFKSTKPEHKKVFDSFKDFCKK